MLIGPAHTHRYRRFADALTGAHARLAEETWMVSPSFQRTFTAYLVPVSLAHCPLLVCVRIRSARLADPPLSWPSAFPVICRRLAKLKKLDLIGTRDSRKAGSLVPSSIS